MRNTEIIRLSLARFATSFLVILIVGVLNRIMIAEFQINRFLVGSILSFQHLITPIALYFGYLSDTRPVRRRRRTPYIMMGMTLCSLPLLFLPDLALQLASKENPALFFFVGIFILSTFGFGVAVSTVALHALIVDRCEPKRRGEALTTVWIITIIGYILAAVAFSLILPDYTDYDIDKLRWLFAGTAAAAILLTLAAVWRQEKPQQPAASPVRDLKAERLRFLKVFTVLASNPHARLLFAFVGMADFFFFLQDYVLEAFGQEVFNLPVGYTTSFNLYWAVGILISMIGLNSLFSLIPGMSEKTMLGIGCVISSLSFLLLAFSSLGAVEAVIMIAVFIMGFGKGVFNVGIARLMVKATRSDISGLVMSLWAVIGGVAIGLGELSGGAVVDIGFSLTRDTPLSYGILFLFEAAGLLLCLALLGMIKIKDYHEDLQRRWPQPVSGDAANAV